MTAPNNADDNRAVAPARVDLRRLIQQHSHILARHTLTLAAARAHSTTADLLTRADPARWVTTPGHLAIPDNELRELVAASIAVRSREASSPIVRRYLESARDALLAGPDAVAERANTLDSIAIVPDTTAIPTPLQSPTHSPAALIHDQTRPTTTQRARRRETPTTPLQEPVVAPPVQAPDYGL